MGTIYAFNGWASKCQPRISPLEAHWTQTACPLITHFTHGCCYICHEMKVNATIDAVYMNGSRSIEIVHFHII